MTRATPLLPVPAQWPDPTGADRLSAGLAGMVAAAVWAAQTVVAANLYDWPATLVLSAALTGGAWLAGRALAAWALRRREPWWTGVIILAALASAFVVQWQRLVALDDVMLLQQCLLAALRNLLLAALVLAAWDRPRRLAAGSGLFVVLLALVVGRGMDVIAAAGCYLVAATLALAQAHWRELQRLPLAGGGTRRRWVPWGLAVGGVLSAAGAALLLYPAQSRALLTSLARWLDETKRDDVREMFEHLAKNRDMIAALAEQRYGKSAAGQGGGESHDAIVRRITEELRTGRKTETGRSHPFSLFRPGGWLPEDADKLMFSLDNENLRHLAVTTFNQFDGRQWRAEDPATGPQRTVQVGSQALWLAMYDPLGMSLDAAGARFSASLLNPGGPGPDDALDLARQAAGRVWDGYFGNAQVVSPEILRTYGMNLPEQLKEPPGHSLDLQYLLTNYDPVAAAQLLEASPRLAHWLHQEGGTTSQRATFLLQTLLKASFEHGDANLPADVKALLATWLAGRPPGWAQIAGVVEGVRGRCRYDPQAVLPPDTADTLRAFLLQTRRGPDYLFASTTAVLLRSLGYPSRLALGFYADPAQRSAWTGRIPVRLGDLHVWPQTRLPKGLWVDLEPTPGFGVAADTPPHPPQPTGWPAFAEELGRRVWALRYAALAAVAACAALAAAWTLWGRWLRDCLATLFWRWRMRSGGVTAIRATCRLLDQRAGLAGHPRPPGRPLGRWYASPVSDGTAPALREPLSELLRMADWALCAPQGVVPPSAWPARAVDGVCRTVGRTWTRARLHKQLAEPHPAGSNAASLSAIPLNVEGVAPGL